MFCLRVFPFVNYFASYFQAIGRCAASIEGVTDTCLNGLVQLLSNRDQAVVAESVVVIKKLLQTQSGEHKEIIVHMAKLLDSIKVPAARAAILWVLGEYSDRVPKVAPDVLRKMAKNFTQEETEETNYDNREVMIMSGAGFGIFATISALCNR